MPELSIESIAQKMLDKHGFFVICRFVPVPKLPCVVREGILQGEIDSAGELGQLSTTASFIVYAEATWDEYVEQCALSGIPAYGTPESGFIYKAIAE